MSREERAKAMRFWRHDDRDRYLASHAMLRLVLSRYVGALPGELEFEVEGNGKPRLRREPNVHLSFNLAHSGDFALLAVSDAPAVGVDIEELRDDMDVPVLAGSVLSDAEMRVFRDAPAQEQRSLFFRTWVRKEAVLKGCGLGLALEPARVVVLHAGTSGDAGLVKVEARKAEWGLRDVAVGDRYAGAVAAPGRAWTLRCFEHRWSEVTPFLDAPAQETRS